MNRKELGAHAKTIKVKGNLSTDLRAFGSWPWISGSVWGDLEQETGAGVRAGQSSTSMDLTYQHLSELQPSVLQLLEMGSVPCVQGPCHW